MPTIQEIRQKYPQYDDMSDQDLADALHSKYYSDLPKERVYESIGLAAQPVEPQAPPQEAAPMSVEMGGQRYGVPQYSGGMADQLKRQIGLTARAGIEGAVALPSIVGDAANAATNYGIRGVNSLVGTKIPELSMVSDSIRSILKEAGLPEPDGVVERIVNIAGGALSGAGVAKVAQAGTAGISSVEPVIKALADSPTLQVAGATGGALASESGKAAGIKNQAGLAALGMVGSLAPGGAATIAKRAAGGAAAAVKPFMETGQEVIAGKVLNRLSTNPSQASATLGAAEEIVPGSVPTVGQASRDPGLISAESAIRSTLDVPGNRIGGRLSEQNAARQTELQRIARDEDTLAQATAKRDATYDEYAVPAFKASTPINIGREVNNNPVLRAIDDIRKTPAGARQSVQKGLNYAEQLITQPGVDLTDAKTLYEIRKDLALARDGKFTDPERSDLRLAGGQLSQIIKSLDGVIESGAPGYQDYLKLYAKRSVPLDQLKAIQEIRSRAVLTASDPVTGQPVLSNAKFQTLLRNNMDRGMNLRETLSVRNPTTGERKTTNQMATLDRIASDLDRGAATTAATMKQPGSDTFKNLSIANVLGAIIGDSAASSAQGTKAFATVAGNQINPLKWLYQVPDEQIQQLIVEAWLDPQLASRLMNKASKNEIESVANELKRRAARQAAAQSVYGQNQ